MIEFTPIVVFALILVVFLQSIFGVGILLFGTPIFLLLGYEFAPVLGILLPISIVINLLQIVRHFSSIDFDLYRRILLFTIPVVFVGLLIVVQFQFSVDWAVGIFLLFVAMKSFFPVLDDLLLRLIAKERSCLISMGLVHGVTNLGGSLLTALIHTKNYPRDAARSTTAIAYCTFAIVQIAALALSSQSSVLSSFDPVYLAMAVAVFVIVEKLVYNRINNERFRSSLAGFILLSGILVIGKELVG